MSNLMRIYTNIQAMKSMDSLSQINNKIAKHQLRLSTGKKINSASDDPAGYQLARSLETRKRGLDAALQNVTAAKNVMNVAEGGYQNIMDILQTVKDKATQAADASISDSQRNAIHNMAMALIAEIDEIVDETSFNTTKLIDGSFTTVAFQTGGDSGDALEISLGDGNSDALGVDVVDLTTAAGSTAAIAILAAAIDTCSGLIQNVGEYKVRLDSKERTLSVASTNTEATRSNVEDADFAKEQMEVLKLQILQQTAVSTLVQAVQSPQIILQLFQ